MKKMILSIAFILISFWGYAQLTGTISTTLSLPSFSLLDIEPNNSTLVLTLAPPTEAGLMNKTTTLTAQKWINYTSALPLLSTKRRITVQMTSGTIPTGIELYIGADAASGGFGQLGTSVAYILINNSAQTLINNIGSSYTGNGINNGHALNYRLNVSNMNLMDADNSTNVNVTFTIIDN